MLKEVICQYYVIYHKEFEQPQGLLGQLPADTEMIAVRSEWPRITQLTSDEDKFRI